MASILVVDDETIICDFLSSLLGREGHTVSGCHDGETALNLLRENSADLVITDQRMTPMGGMELLKRIHEQMPSIPVILISGYGNTSMVIESLKCGAFDFLAKPIRMDTLRDTISRALKFKKLMAGQVLDEGGRIPDAYCLDLLIGESPAMKEVCWKVQQAAMADTPVLISGPDGTGKGVVAQAIHRVGPRAERPFTTVDCAVETDESLRRKLYGETGLTGLLFSHAGGTLHLRNIDKSSTEFQKDLFAILKSKCAIPSGALDPVSVGTRILVSTTAALIKLVGLNQFRPELYTHLSRVNIALKPVAERSEDILPLFLYILRDVLRDPDREFELEDEARRVLQHHPWPGNGNEMESLALQLAGKLTDNLIRLDMLPPMMVHAVQSSSQADPEKNIQAAESLRGIVAREFLRKKHDKYQAYLAAQEASQADSGTAEAQQ